MASVSEISHKAPLLDDEDGLSAPFEAVLEAVFRQFAPSSSTHSQTPLKDLSLKKKELDAFSLATNGQRESLPICPSQLGQSTSPRLTLNPLTFPVLVCSDDARDVR